MFIIYLSYGGCRLGKSIPWVHEFPYSHLRDPQYIGSILTLCGSALIGNPLEVVGWWLANYFYLMWLESRVPGADAM